MFNSPPPSFLAAELTTNPQIGIPESSGPQSIISSKMTDNASEDSHGNNFEGSTANRRIAARTQSGKGMSDRSRPASAMSSQTRNSHRAPQSRREVPLVGYSLGESFGGPGGSMWNTSRPPSVTSQASKTHVPSLAAQAFFRPMSSQRLQARRGRQAESSHSGIPLEEASEAGQTAVRHSLTSHPVKIIHHSTPVPPRSGGTEISDREDRVTMTASPNGETTVRDSGESERPLQAHSFHVGPGHRSSASNSKQGSSAAPPNKNSPKTFRSKILSTPPENADNRGHERLASKNSTSHASAKSDNSAPPKVGKNYQYFLGNTVFCFGGRFQNSRDIPFNILSAIIAVIPTILFLCYSAPWLWHHISPAIPVLFAYIFFICVSSLIHASATDPGILPRNLHYLNPPPKSRDAVAIPNPPTAWRRMKYLGKGSKAMDIPVKYCKTCNIWRPPRCHHCRICDNCIDAQDHHCMWINNCVGRRNYRYFLAFLSSATILGIFVLAASLTHVLGYMSTNELSFAQTIDELRIPFALAIYGLLAFPYPACLWSYHIFLSGKSDTTREYLASKNFPKPERYTPYTNGSLIKNWAVAFLRPKPPSSMEFKRPWMVGDQRFGHFAMVTAKDEDLPPPATGKKRSGNQIELSTIGEDVNQKIYRPRQIDIQLDQSPQGSDAFNYT